MIILAFLVFSCVAAQRGHYIVDYQRLPLYQEFYLSPGLYRPFFPSKTEHHSNEGRSSVSTDHDSVTINNQALIHDQQQFHQEVSPQHVQQVTASSAVPEPESSASDLQGVVPEPQTTQEVHEEPIHSVPVLTYSNSMTPDGSYAYKYETSDGMMREESSVMQAREDGQMVATVRGSYSYPGPDGRLIRVDYIADEGGFRATGDHLPSVADATYNFKYVVPS